ncbi:MAG: recombinase RecT [Geminicoccaceae bacterium]
MMATNGNLPAIIVRLRDPKVIAEMSAAVPSHVDATQWLRVLQTSVMNDRNLLGAKPDSLLREAVKLAQVGLTTDPHLGEAYLFADSKGSCQARVDYKGLIKLGRQAGAFTQIYAQDICANDPVKELRAGNDRGIDHKVALSNRGERLGYYAFVKFTDGTVDFEWMELGEIYAIRDRFSQAYKSGKTNPWGTAEGEMCKKTVLHRLLKRLPKSTQLERAMSMENEANFPETPMKDVTPEAAPISTMDALADKIAADATPELQDNHDNDQEAGDDIVDTDTGEVTEGASEQPQPQHGQVHEQEGFDLGPVAIQLDMVRKGPKPTFQTADDAYKALCDRLDELDAIPGVRTLAERNQRFISTLPMTLIQDWCNAVDDKILSLQEQAA